MFFFFTKQSQCPVDSKPDLFLLNMSDVQPKSSRKRKIITAIALLLVLGVFPLISWYYLSNGLQWRKDAKAELGSFGQIRGAYIIYPDGTKENQLAESVCVLHNFGANPELTDVNKGIINTYQRLYDQFGKMSDGNTPRPYFKLVLIYEGGTSEFRSEVQKIPSIDYATWVVTGGLGSWGTILTNGYEKYTVERKLKPLKETFALADVTGQIRCFYDATDEKQVTRMVEQIALMLPK